jgi:hypothetical protein
MPSISATLQISTGEFDDLKNLPQQLEKLVGDARKSLQSITDGGAGGNPISTLLGNLNGLGGQAANLPDLGPIIAPVQSLVQSLPSAGFADMTALRDGIDEMLAGLGPITELVRGGKLDTSLQDGVTRAVEAVGGLLKPGDDATGLLGQLAQFLKMFESVQSWQQRAPTPQALVEILAPLLIGASTDLLEKPFGQLRIALNPLREVLIEGPDLSAWRGVLPGRVSFWTELNAQLSGPLIDWNGIELKLQAELNTLIQLRAARDRLLSASLANLTRLDLIGIGQVGGSVVTIPRPPEFRFSQIMDGLRSYIEGLAERLEAWEPTPEELRALTTNLTGSFQRFLEESPLGELRDLLLRCHHRLMLAIESLPFRDLAAKMEAALRKVADAINVVDPDLIRRPIQEFFTTIDAKIKEIPVAQVLGAVQAAWQSVNDVFQQINTQLVDLKNTLQGLVANVKTLEEQLKPTLDSINSAVATVQAQLSSFDLKDASSLVVDQLHDLRDTVAELDFSILPNAALSALHAGAQTLKGLDVAGTVNPPLNEILAKVDPTPQLESVTATLSAATGQLKAIDPASVVTQLDKPVDELLKVLSEFGPDKLRSLLDAALQPVNEALRGLDFATALAPVTRIYADLFARVDSVLNPDPIFEPLNDFVQPVVDVIDAIQPSRLLNFATSQAGPMAQATTSSTGPPGAIKDARATLQAIPAAPEGNEPLFGFRPGDMLMPVIDLYRQLMQVVDGFSDDLLNPAAALLHEAFSARLESLFPSSVEIEVSANLDVVIGEFDSGRVTSRLLPAGAAFQTFVETFTAKSANLQAGDAAVALRIGSLLPAADPLALAPAQSQSGSVAAACAQVQAGLRLEGLQNAARHLSSLQEMLPPFLKAATATAESLRQFLRDLDPAPIRSAINEAFDRIGRRIVALQDPLMTGIDAFMRLVEDFLLPITPAALLELADRLHEAVKEQLLAFHPNTFKDEVKIIFDVVKAQVKAFDPSVIVTELNKQRDLLLKTLHDFVGQILPDPAQFIALQQTLAGLKPSEILKPAVEILKPVSEVLAKIDIKIVLEPLIEAIARVRAQLPEVVAEIEAALDEVLDAIPEGGASSVSASASVG